MKLQNGELEGDCPLFSAVQASLSVVKGSSPDLQSSWIYPMPILDNPYISHLYTKSSYTLPYL